jgi:hypothetical protein
MAYEISQLPLEALIRPVGQAIETLGRHRQPSRLSASRRPENPARPPRQFEAARATGSRALSADDVYQHDHPAALDVSRRGAFSRRELTGKGSFRA